MRRRGNESPLKDKAFSIFLDKNPPFEPRRKTSCWACVEVSLVMMLAFGILAIHRDESFEARGANAGSHCPAHITLWPSGCVYAPAEPTPKATIS